MADRGWGVLVNGLRRRSAALSLLLMAAVLVAVAAGPPPIEDAWVGVPSLRPSDRLVTVVTAVMIVLTLIIVVLAANPQRREGSGRRRSILPLLFFVSLILILGLDREDAGTEITLDGSPVESAEPVDTVPPGPGLQRSDTIVILMIAAAAIGVAWWFRARRDEAGSASADRPDTDGDLEPALARATRHLLDGDDPRTAVLLAYHELETTFDTLGLGRRPTETPTEHLRRALAHHPLGAPDPGTAEARALLDLAGLYGRARYSHHEISVDEQRRAAEALERALSLVRRP